MPQIRKAQPHAMMTRLHRASHWPNRISGSPDINANVAALPTRSPGARSPGSRGAREGRGKHNVTSDQRQHDPPRHDAVDGHRHRDRHHVDAVDGRIEQCRA